MEELYVLVLDGIPVAAAERMERLSEEMSTYGAQDQELMFIQPVEVLD